MTTGKTIALTRWTFVGKVLSLLFNTLSRLVITFLPRSKRLLISWLQSPSACKMTAYDEIWLSPNLELDRKPEQSSSAGFWYHQWLDGWELVSCLEEYGGQTSRYVHHFWTLALIASWLDRHCRLLHKVFVSTQSYLFLTFPPWVHSSLSKLQIWLGHFPARALSVA